MSAREGLLVLTVGASLFHSASWTDAAVRREVPAYPALASEPDAEVRQSRRAAVAQLEDVLRADNAAAWAERLRPGLLRGAPVPGETASFYSAEVTTLLRLAARRESTLRELLRGCSAVWVAADDQPAQGERARSWTAANHLAAYLDAAAGGLGTIRLLRIRGLASSRPDLLLGSGAEPTGLRLLVARIEELAAEHPGAPIDLVVTGGFKLYGYALAALVVQRPDLRARLIYAHERAARLVEMASGEISLDGVGVPWPGSAGLALGGRGDAP